MRFFTLSTKVRQNALEYKIVQCSMEKVQNSVTKCKKCKKP